jgi:hypothetical protein
MVGASRAGKRGFSGGVVEAAVAVAALVVSLGGLPACRVGPPIADALVAPFPDSAAGRDVGDVGDVGKEASPGTCGTCDLLLQNCAQLPSCGSRRTCYPADGQPGVTSCELTGSAPPQTFCATSLDCDAREACVFVAESQMMMCATLCDPSAAITGCLGGAMCRPMSGYRAGFCVP